jgi:hypothetical protein
MKQGDVICENGYSVNSNCYSLAKERIQVQIKDIIDMPDGEFENLVERLFNEAKKELTMSLFVCAKCGCVDNTATSSYWMLTNEYMVDKFDYAKELQPYKGMGLCSECGRLATSPDGRDVVVPGKWHGKFPKEKATEEQLKHVGYKNLIR